ncbi:nuclear fragile X mental retardation-interacting protein 1-domain-containing protein [Mycena maculata]|uniref:Nuclear fragile X mental retardation-interacting protein 1-domain-containing protein n=1 Tax=Mycena maculata TaxID=230809 RepID=A0AAD7KG30_9AGAR|nr:nuclear fragile X mental retardation-interacting protein 1-domain-containing protein [Mycena maculata]
MQQLWAQQSYYSSHYVQAYMQQQQYALPATPQGYTLSSTYNPNSSAQTHNTPGPSAPPSAAWYQPGNSRCTYKDCTFRGSAQTVETHMMDRHLIFPSGWDKRKKKPEWDADPSLKGKPIPIQGTTIILDSPEELDAWIAERKRRWPSAPRVEEKKRKMEEAIARGQLSLENSGFAGARKRKRTDEPAAESTSRGRGRGNGRGRGQQRARGVDAGWRGRGIATARSAPAREQDVESSSDSDDDDAPEIVSSRMEQVAPPPPPPIEVKQQKARPPPQPKQPVRSPFASRPTLLRNLLLPEIRITVSNLSQAIRFLVDNDFLQNVELRPGQANKKLIEVLRREDAAVL